MTGSELRTYLKNEGIELKDLAERLCISPQTLNSRLNARSIKSSTIEEIEKAINKKLPHGNPEISSIDPFMAIIESQQRTIESLSRTIENLSKK
jgi:transcriptional regulator with XRE-family HTH domain